MTLKHWISAARPKTLWAAVGPVAVGTAMAAGEGAADLRWAAVALLGAILLQIGTNFCNDLADHLKGADHAGRVGPARAVAMGWISPERMLVATVLTFSLAGLLCLAMVFHAGWPMLLLGAVSIAAGVAYTAGPYPLAYKGLGDLFVLVFFGPVAAAGTHYVQALTFSPLAALAGLGPGLLAVAILVVNNLRDIESDAIAGKRTLAVRFGARAARIEYTACILGAAALPFLLVHLDGPHRGNALVASMVAFAAWPVLRLVWTRTGAALNPGLGMTALMLLVYSLSFSLGWLIVTR
jgi:1,4-dihydroxy-2-naphthoate octaprenyltransferase